MPVIAVTSEYSPKDVILEMMALMQASGEFKHIDQWQNQPYYDVQEIPYPAPAIFFEFLGADYEDMANAGAQIAADLYKVWIEVDSNAETWVGVEQEGAWDWNDKCIAAHRVLQNAQLDSLASQLVRVSQMKESSDNLGVILYSMTYKAARTDATGMNESTEAAPTSFVPLGSINTDGEEED